MHERVYVGGRVEGYVNVFDVDAPKYASFARRTSTRSMEQRHLVVAELVFYPSGARMRESLSYDLPLVVAARLRARGRAVQVRAA